MITKDIKIGIFMIFLLILSIFIFASIDSKNKKNGMISSKDYRVIDGDSIVLNGTKIRLFGIDAPEIKQICTQNNEKYSCGEESKDFLLKLLADSSIYCDIRGTDRYRRQLSVCWKEAININKTLVKEGWAIAYTQYSSIFLDDQKYAMENKKGMWSGEFDTPHEWRKNRRNKNE